MSDLLREYKSTHPWITFNFDLNLLSWTDFQRFGEAMSKCDHLAGAPLMPSVSSELHLVYLVKGVLATTAIEGNTMSEDQVRQRVEGRSDLPPSREYQGLAVDNIVAVCNEILGDVARGAAPQPTPELIMAFNRRVLAGQDLDADTEPGTIRRHSVVVGRYRGAPAGDCEHLLGELCDWLGRSWVPDDDPRPVELRSTVTVLKAILAHLYLAWIHPFGDGNGRTARLLEFLILVTSGVPSPAAHLLSNHYNLTRDRYYQHLDRSSAGPAGVAAFVSYALEGFVDGLRDQIDAVRSQQMQVTWTNYVHERFHRHRMTETQRRRREVVLTMRVDTPVPKAHIPDLSPTIARLYATKGDKTVSRDVNALVGDGLIRKTPDGYVPRTELVEAFLPIRADVDG